MKKIILFSIFCYTIIYSTESQAQVDRLVYWVHGLGGKREGWLPVSNATNSSSDPTISSYPRRKIASPSIGFEDNQQSLDDASYKINSDILATNYYNTYYSITDKTKNIIIAHSLGGLVTRNLDRLYGTGNNRPFGGIVTFGTPHQGAYILNHIGDFPGFASNACSKISDGSIHELGLAFAGPFAPLVTPLITSVDNLSCDFLGSIVPVFFGGFTQPIKDDFYVGAPKLTTVNNFQSTLPKVAFYGIEDKNTQFWRVISNMLPSNKPQDFPAFQTSDDNLVTFQQDNIQFYMNKVNNWDNVFNSISYCSWYSWIINPVGCGFNDGYKTQAHGIAAGYQNGVDWFNQANDQWRTITGSLRYDPVTSTGYQCNCTLFNYQGQVISTWTSTVANASSCFGGSPQNGVIQSCQASPGATITTYVPVDEDSDGVVVKSSASNFPQGASPTLTPTRDMPGSNHLQMRNDSNTKLRLNELFKGDYGNYFITSPQ